MNTSLTGVGATIVTFINLVLPLLGFDIDPLETEGVVISAVNIVGFITMIYGQWRRKEVTGFIFKK